ncbi:hypothetical protein LINPERHAP2_LOCUS21372 [Linum perenne]
MLDSFETGKKVPPPPLSEVSTSWCLLLFLSSDSEHQQHLPSLMSLLSCPCIILFLSLLF